MKKAIKFVLSLLILLIFIGSVGILSQFFEVPVLSSKVDDWIRMFPWVMQFFKGILISLIIILFFLFLLTFAISGKRTAIYFKNKNRQIKIPKKTIEAIIGSVADEIIHADKRKLKIKIKRKNRVVVRLKLLVRSKTRDQPIANELKREIETTLVDALQVTNHLINIKLVEIDSETKVFGSNKSRVV